MGIRNPQFQTDANQDNFHVLNFLFICNLEILSKFLHAISNRILVDVTNTVAAPVIE